MKHLIVGHISSETIIENPFYDYDIKTPKTEQIETRHDPQDTFHDTHQIVNKLLGTTQ